MNIMRYDLKSQLLVLAVCATIIEILPGISLTIGLIYLIVSFCDNFLFKKHVRIYNKAYLLMANSWIVLLGYITLVTILMPSIRTDVFAIDFKWVRCILFFILVYRDTLDKEPLIKDLLLCYASSAIVCAILMNMGIGVAVDLETYELGEVRLSFLGTNSNKMSMIFLYAATIVLFYYESSYKKIKEKIFRLILCVCVIILLCLSMSFTGSRGGLICFFIVLLYYFIVYKHSNNVTTNIYILFLSTLVFGFIFYKLSRVEVLSERFNDALSGNLGERDVLAKIGFDIFVDNPLFGVGMIAVPEYIHERIGVYLTTHNLYVYMLASGGIIGFMIFFLIIYTVCKTIYFYSFKYRRQFIPVALLLIVLIDWMKNGGALVNVINYIMLSLACSISHSSKNIEKLR